MPLNPEFYLKNSAIQYHGAQKYFHFLDIKNEDQILDVGFGDGKITAELASRYPTATFKGIDFSQEMVSFAKANFPLKNVSFSYQDVCTLKEKNVYDWILSFSCLHWVPDQKMALEVIYQALKKKGKSLILTYPADSPYWIFLNKTIQNPKWQAYKPTLSNCKIQDYQGFLDSIPFSVKKIIPENHVAIYHNKNELKEYIKAWLASVISLPEALAEEFLDEAAHNAECIQVDKKDGLLHLPYTSVVFYLEK